MPPITHIEELFQRTTDGVKFDLERMRRMCALSGDPQLGVPTVLVAGTNGKGSVTAMWGEALRRSGRCVGIYTSPHLVRFNERLLLKAPGRDQEIADAELAELLRELSQLEGRAGFELTFFEAATWMAFTWFKRQGAQALVLEVGMGGRLDATNVSDPLVSVLTSIGLDHTEFLGPTLVDIAREKAAIGRVGRPLVVAPLADGAVRAAVHAASGGARVVELEQGVAATPTMVGAHQQRNAALFALSAAQAPAALGLSAADIAAGMGVQVPGRYQRFVVDGLELVLDGAHNAQAVAALCEVIRADAALPRPRRLVFGGTRGRDPRETLAMLAPEFDEVWVCPPATPRAIPIDALLAVAPGARVFQSFADVQRALTSEGPARVLLTGSLYLVGEALAWLQRRPRDGLTDFR